MEVDIPCAGQKNGKRCRRSQGARRDAVADDRGSALFHYAQLTPAVEFARIDEVLSVVNSVGKFWYQADALGSVYGLTNQAGALIGSQNYDVFGAPTPAPTGPAGQPFGFTGREHDQGGLVYSRARYLNPAVGRWDRPDPLGFVDGSNRYLYVADRPSGRTDPRGLFAAEIHRQITRAAFAGTLVGDDLERAVTVKAATVSAQHPTLYLQKNFFNRL